MLLTKEVTTVVNNNMIKYYRSKGYDCKGGDTIIVKVEDLKPGSNMLVEVKCDYCGEFYITQYSKYYKSKEECIIKKDCCEKCTILKMNDTMISKYGTSVMLNIPQFKEKVEQTNLEKYGATSPLGSAIIREKSKETFKDKYGVEEILESPEIRKKIKSTNLEKYGCENPAQNNEVKAKMKATNLEKYGNSMPLLGDDFIENTRKRIPVSIFQNYLYQIYGGELNKPIKGYFVDLLLDDNIYCEYNGTGHNLTQRFQGLTDEEFDKKEKQRYHILKRQGLKLFQIVQGPYEKTPSQEVLEDMLLIAQDFLLAQNYNWISFDFEHNTYSVKDKVVAYDFGKMESVYNLNK